MEDYGDTMSNAELEANIRILPIVEEHSLSSSLLLPQQEMEKEDEEEEENVALKVRR